MPTESVVAVSLIVCGFVVFMITLAWVSLYTRTRPEAAEVRTAAHPPAPPAKTRGLREAA